MIKVMARSVRTAIKRPGAGVAIVPERLIRLRTTHSPPLSRAQLAEKMSAGDDDWKITPDAIAKIENGHRRPKTSTLSRLCEALGCEPEDLLPDVASSRRYDPGGKNQAIDSPRVPCQHCGALFGHEPGCRDAT
jgi:transcriptional regulator with XRE-family HTH domain